jgi:hypothetical protein
MHTRRNDHPKEAARTDFVVRLGVALRDVVVAIVWCRSLISSDLFLKVLELRSSVPQPRSSMISTLSSVSGPAGSVCTIEHDRGAFLEVDCPSLSFDLARLGSHGTGSSILSRSKLGHDEDLIS